MPRVIRPWWTLALVASLLVAGCGTGQDKQWYKPSGNYTVTEFARDRDACTKNRELDEQCLKQRGWLPLTSDREPAPPPKPPPSRGRY